MKILLTNTTLCNFFGTQVFTYSLAVEFKKLGHEVFCFSTVLGQIAQRLRAQGVPVTDDLTNLPTDIDIVHAHHRHESLLAFAGFQQTPMIMVCHGVLPWQEQPLRPRMNICRYVAVSEEVRDHLIAQHRIPEEQISIIRNGVDTRRFYSKKPVNDTLKRLLVLSNHAADEQLQVVRDACERKGIEFEKIGFPAENVWNVEDHINEADVVVTLGRGALEAAACKRVVIIHDYNGGDGLLTRDNFQELRGKNFSGRTNRVRYSTEEFLEVLERYDPTIPEGVYEHIPNHDLTAVVQRYISVYEEAIHGFRMHGPVHISHELFHGVSEVFLDFKSEAALQDKQLREARASIQKLTTDARRLEVRLRELEEGVAEKDAQLARTEERLRLKREGLSGKDRKIDEIQDLLEKKCAEFAEKVEALADTEKTLSETILELGAKTECIKRLEEKVSKNQVATASLQAQLDQVKREMDDELQRFAAVREGERQGYEERIREAEQQVYSLLGSKSWKITAPLRKIGRIVRGK